MIFKQCLLWCVIRSDLFPLYTVIVRVLSGFFFSIWVGNVQRFTYSWCPAFISMTVYYSNWHLRCLGVFFFRDAQFSKMYLLYSWLSLCCISISLYCNGICVLFWTTIWRNKSDLKLTMLSLDFRRSWKIYYFDIFLNNSYSPKRFLSTLHIKYQTKQIQSFTNYCMSLKCI